jgi:hypothetical protein
MAMRQQSLKKWLSSANGWQRIWFVCSCLTFLYYLVVYPLSESNAGNSFRYNTKWSVEKEMKNPQCAIYMSAPFNQLAEPEYSANGEKGCYHIYVHRQFLDGNVAITESSYKESFTREERERWMTFLGMGALIATVLTAFAYGCGTVVSWVIQGFKRSKKNELS